MDICTPVFYVRIIYFSITKLFFSIFLFISSFATLPAYRYYPLAYISTVTSSVLHSPPNIVLTTPILFSTFLYLSLPYSLSLFSLPDVLFLFPFLPPFPLLSSPILFLSLSLALLYSESPSQCWTRGLWYARQCKHHMCHNRDWWYFQHHPCTTGPCTYHRILYCSICDHWF